MTTTTATTVAAPGAPASSSPSDGLPHESSDPTAPLPLFHILQAISDLLNAAVVANDVAFAFTLNESVRRHLVTPIRKRLYQSCQYPYSQLPLDAPYEHRATARRVHTLLCSLLLRSPATSLAQALDGIQTAVNGLDSNSLSYKVLVAVWKDLVVLLRNHIYSWFTAAVVDDPRHQFFISTTVEPIVVAQRLPSFVPLAVAERVLFVGNVRKCRIVLARERREFLPELDDLHGLRQVMTHPLFAELELEAASLRWRTKAAHDLSQLLPFDRIRNRVILLRQYLLLGHSAFWRSFFDELRSIPFLLTSRELNDEDRDDVEKSVMRILSYTFQDFAGESLALTDNSLSWASILKLQVTSSGDIVPQFTLSFAESRVLASRASVYCDVFSITFNVRRVGCELRDAFGNLQFLDRQLRLASPLRKRREATATLVQTRELRRRMAIFVDGFEWYLQADVLQPKFERLLALLDSRLEDKEISAVASRQPFFDTITSMHESLLDKVFEQCFVGQHQINSRLNGIFAACFSLSDFVQELTVDVLKYDHFTDTLTALETSFSRNVGLLVRLLLHIQHGSVDSRIPALLARINFNDYLHSE